MNGLRWKAALAACIFLLPVEASAELDPRERAVVEIVDRENERSIALLEKLVNINSGTLNLQGVKAVADVLESELKPLGFETHWESLAEVERAGHLVARRRGTGTHMLLIGHMDTVFEPSSPFQKFRREGDVATGPGIFDMKGGLVTMVAALRALNAAGLLDGLDITIFLSGDEERAGTPISRSRATLMELGRAADVALEFEPPVAPLGKESMSLARRGGSVWRLNVTASSGHSSQIGASLGAGAAAELVRVLGAFAATIPEPGLTFNVGLMASGTTVDIDAREAGVAVAGKDNIVPPAGFARGEFRSLTPELERRAAEKMRAAIGTPLPGTKSAIEIERVYPPMAPKPGNQALLDLLNQINAEAGLPVQEAADPMSRGGGDISYVAEQLDALVGFGLGGANPHSEKEEADLSSLARQAKRAALLLRRLGTMSGR